MSHTHHDNNQHQHLEIKHKHKFVPLKNVPYIFLHNLNFLLLKNAKLDRLKVDHKEFEELKKLILLSHPKLILVVLNISYKNAE